MRKQDETMKVIYYSWEESIQDLHELVRQMSIDRFRPQVIVGISRGGLPPAVMLSAYYDIPLKPLKASLRHFPQWEEYMPYPTDQDRCLLYTSPSPRDNRVSRMPSSA